MKRLIVAISAALMFPAFHCVAADAGAAEAPLTGASPSAIRDGFFISRPKSASTQSLGTRATVTPSATLFGGFQIINTTNVYILIRGNSLGTLGITQNYLDFPRLRVYDANGVDLLFDNTGAPGINFCTNTGTFSAPVRQLYQGRGADATDRDACTAHSFAPGVYTFTVTPSSASTFTSGEVLFEVTLNP